MASLAQQNHPVSNRFFMNPLIRKLTKVEEQSQSHTASYGGIAAKTLFFLLVLVLGAASQFFIHPYLGTDVWMSVNGANLSFQEGILLVVCVFLTAITPMAAFLIRPVIPVAGALYCAATGYLIAWLANTYSGEYAGPIWGALALTVLVVLLMAVLYAAGIVKVNHKFRTVVTVLFLTTVFSGLLSFLCSFIPPLRPFWDMIRENAIFSLISAVVFVVIAALFLLVDFDTIYHSVENRLPKKYEWVAAFGLTFTVIWLYFKILDLILRAKQSGSSNSR